MTPKTKQILTAAGLAPVVTAIAWVLISGCLSLVVGCTTTLPNGQKQVSPIVVQITESVACAGAAFAVAEKPEIRAPLQDARRYLDLVLTYTNFSKVNLTDIIGGFDGGTWIEPAVALFYSWSGDPASARLILQAIRNGLDCAFLTPTARLEAGDWSGHLLAASAPVATGQKADRVDVYKDIKGQWRWRRVAPNNRIVSVWGESSRWQSSALRSAKRCNPSCEVTLYK